MFIQKLSDRTDTPRTFYSLNFMYLCYFWPTITQRKEKCCFMWCLLNTHSHIKRGKNLVKICPKNYKILILKFRERWSTSYRNHILLWLPKQRAKATIISGFVFLKNENEMGGWGAELLLVCTWKLWNISQKTNFEKEYIYV